ncbi:hypothetical protein FRC11_012152, partial [Ceratobasidium sp. 423]
EEYLNCDAWTYVALRIRMTLTRPSTTTFLEESRRDPTSSAATDISKLKFKEIE